MAVVADRVIVELEAKLDRYEANVRRAEAKFDSATRSISGNSAKMARDIERNSAAAGASIRNMAGALAAAFSARQVISLADSYTRFTNQLKLAGAEGETLARRQEQLFTIAQRYGVELESLGSLYAKGSSAAKDLGASQADLLRFTEGVSAALKIQGGSAASTSGALQQLTQLLGGANVQAEEFNSIVDGARPILTAVAANLDGAGGSVSRLKALVNDGKVTSKAFFEAFLKGSADLQKQAQAASLTIGNSFTILNNALGKYIGEADASLSATQRVSQGIISLSHNLDTVAGALGVIAAILTGRFVAGLVRSAAATGVASTALFAMQARAVGAATTMEALAVASRAAGASMLAAFGGPVGLAIAALAVGVYYLTTRTGEAAQASGEYAQRLEQLKTVKDRVSDATDRLSTATGKARVEALANAKAVREETVQYLAQARAALLAAQAKARAAVITYRQEAAAAKAAPAPGVGSGGTPGMGFSPSAAAARVTADQAVANLNAAKTAESQAAAALAGLDKAVAAPPRVGTAAAGKPGKKNKGPKGPKGPDPDDLARRFSDDLARAELDLEQALAEAKGTQEARQELELKRIEAERTAAQREIATDKNFSAAQKAQLEAVTNQVAAAREAAVFAERERDAAEGALNLRLADLTNAQDLASAQARLAETTKDKLAAELRIIDLQYREEQLRLESIRDNERLTAAEREAAKRRLAALPGLRAADEAGAQRDAEGPLAKRVRELNARGADRERIAEQLVVDELQHVQDGITNALTNALGTKDPLISGLINLFIEQVIMKPLAEAFQNASGSGGSALGAIVAGIGSLFTGGKRASGGHVNAGRIYQINDGGGTEGFQPAGSGKIIPLGRMNRAGGGNTNLHLAVSVDNRGSVNPEGFADTIVAAVRKETLGIVTTAVKGVNKGVPARLAQYQRDGN